MSQLISVIITTHNRLDLLKKAVKSVKEQTYNNFECFIIDDASDIDISNEVKDIVDDRFELIRITKNDSKGSNYARNVGIIKANGEYITFLDDDDTWEAEKLSKQIQMLNNNVNAGVCYCLRRFVYTNGKATYEKFLSEQEGDCSKRIFYNIIGTTSSLMIDSKILKEEIFDENLKFWQEYDLMIRLCQKTEVVCVKEHLVNYLINFEDKSRKTNKYIEWLDSVKKIYEKHTVKIGELSSDEDGKRLILFYQDACNRLFSSGRKKERRFYYKKIFQLNGSVKFLVKYLLNIDNIDLQKIKSKYNNSKGKY